MPPAEQPQEQYAWVKHQPGECRQVQKFAAVRWMGGNLRVDLEAHLSAVSQPIALTWGGAVPAAPVEAGHAAGDYYIRFTQRLISALSAQTASKEELAELRRLLEEYEKGAR